MRRTDRTGQQKTHVSNPLARGVRDRYALPPEWGNGITHVAEGEIEAGNPNITSWGTASPETTPSGTYSGGAPEMTIRNSTTNVKNLRVSELEYEEDR